MPVDNRGSDYETKKWIILSANIFVISPKLSLSCNACYFI